mgnify:CR=1 FL=1
MPHKFDPFQKNNTLEFFSLFQPAIEATSRMPVLNSKGNRPLQMTFEEHLRALVYFHLEEHHSAQHLLQVLEEDDFARSAIAPENGIKKSSFSEATNSRGSSPKVAVNFIPSDWCPFHGIYTTVSCGVLF